MHHDELLRGRRHASACPVEQGVEKNMIYYGSCVFPLAFTVALSSLMTPCMLKRLLLCQHVVTWSSFFILAAQSRIRNPSFQPSLGALCEALLCMSAAFHREQRGWRWRNSAFAIMRKKRFAKANTDSWFMDAYFILVAHRFAIKQHLLSGFFSLHKQYVGKNDSPGRSHKVYLLQQRFDLLHSRGLLLRHACTECFRTNRRMDCESNMEASDCLTVSTETKPKSQIKLLFGHDMTPCQGNCANPVMFWAFPKRPFLRSLHNGKGLFKVRHPDKTQKSVLHVPLVFKVNISFSNCNF